MNPKTDLSKLPDLPFVLDKTGRKYLLVDHSSLDWIRSCPAGFDLSYLRERVSADPGAARNFGSGMHVAMAARYRLTNEVSQNLTEAMHDALREHFDEHPQPLEEYRNFGFGLNLINAYNKRWPKEDFRVMRWIDRNGLVVPAVERSVSFPLGEVQWNRHETIGIVYCGKIDLVVEDVAQHVFVLDFKTASQFGRTWDADMMASDQFPGYVWALRQKGFRVHGAIVRGLRTRKPLKNADCMPFMGIRPFDEGAGKDADFRQLQRFLNDDDIAAWRQRTLDLCDEIIWYYQRGRFTQKRKHCVMKFGQCAYYNVCNQSTLRESQDMFDSAEFVDTTWSPLEP